MATILVVDDSPDDRRLTVMLATHLGHEVSEAARGDDGLRMARTSHPDLVISDLLMPGIDGFDLARTIRTDPSFGSTRVIFCTAATDDPQFRELAARCGVDRVIPKPSEPQAILDVIAGALATAPPPPIAAPREAEFERDHLTMLTEALGRKVEELKRTNAELQRGEARFRALLESAPEPIIGVDRAGRVTLANALAISLFGYTIDELIGQPVEVLVPETSREVHRHNRDAYLASPMVRPMGVGIDLEALRKDGSRFPVSVALSTIDTEDDVVVLAAVTDLTERVVALREREELEARLHQAQRIESIGLLAGGIAHDFNNLLAVIINSAHFALEGVEPGTVLHEDLEQVLIAGNRAADLTRQLLLFSRLEPSAQQAVDLADLIASLSGLLRRLIEENIIFETEWDADLPRVLADQSKLEQVILNLVVNARDAMPTGGSLRISASAVDLDGQTDAEPGRYVRLQVADTGIGIDPGAIDRVFDPFFTTKGPGSGTGLGLSTVYGVVKQAGGDVTISSEVGVGTTVSVYLPVAPQASTAPTPNDATGTLGGTERVLVVEDEDAVRGIAQRMLVRYGYDVSVAALPSEALAMVESSMAPPDLVLADVIMPEMSGPDLVARLAGSWPGVRAVFMSGYTGEKAAIPAGAPLLYKPFVAEVLARTIREVLDRR